MEILPSLHYMRNLSPLQVFPPQFSRGLQFQTVKCSNRNHLTQCRGNNNNTTAAAATPFMDILMQLHNTHRPSVPQLILQCWCSAVSEKREIRTSFNIGTINRFDRVIHTADLNSFSGAETV